MLLGPDARLVLAAAALLNGQRIPRSELEQPFGPTAGWKRERFDQAVDEAADVRLLDGSEELHVHQVHARFVLEAAASEIDGATLARLRNEQFTRGLSIARELKDHPERVDLSALLAVYPVDPPTWSSCGVDVSVADGEVVGRALLETGRFGEAQPWYERAVAATERGDVHGRVDHESLGASLHCIGHCLSRVGRFGEAQPWYERAVAAAERGDVHGRVETAQIEAFRKSRDTNGTKGG